MGDQDHCEVVLAAEAVEQPEDPGLHGDVERRRRLVGDQQLRTAGEGDRDRDPLAHPAGELVRVGAEGLGPVRDAHLLEQLERTALGGAAVEAEVVPDVLGQLPADREHRVQRRHRILEDHREVAPGELAPARGGEGEQVAPVEAHAPLDGGAVRQHAEQSQHRHRLAAAALPGDAEHLALLDPVVDPVDDGEQPACPRAAAPASPSTSSRLIRPAS